MSVGALLPGTAARAALGGGGARFGADGGLRDANTGFQDLLHQAGVSARQVCRYLVKDFGTSQSPKSTRQRDSRYCPDRPALITTPSRTLQQSCSCATPS
ncbi:MAG: hypothetical protein G8D58_13155 [gamma proteobacterium symbiont of Phacoides pectinatus]